MRYTQGRRAIRGEVAGGTHGGEKRCRRHILGQPWSKYHGKLGGINGVRVKHSRVRGGGSGAGKWVIRYSGMETGNTQVDG